MGVESRRYLEVDEAGNAIPTYDNDDIAEFAKVLQCMRRPFRSY